MTHQWVDALKFDGRQRDFYDAGQRRLVLRVSKHSKNWRVIIRGDKGQPQGQNIGRFPDVSVKQARELAAAALVRARERRDSGMPAIEAKPAPLKTTPEPVEASQSRALVVVRQIPVDGRPKPDATYRELADYYFQEEPRARNYTSANEIRRMLDKIILPVWGPLPYARIDRDDALDLLAKVARERGPRSADMVLAITRRIANFAQLIDKNYYTPFVKGMAKTDASQRIRSRVLNDAELVVMWEACGKLGTFGALVKCLLLLGQRRTRVATMQRSAIHDGIWHLQFVPKRQKGVPLAIQLPSLVQQIIAEQPTIKGIDWVFPSTRHGRHAKPGAAIGSFCAYAQHKAELDRIMRQRLPDMPQWQLHDLRRTARTRLSQIGVSEERAERVLAHGASLIVQVYNQHRYQNEIGEDLEKLAAHISQLVAPKAPTKAKALKSKPAPRQLGKAGDGARLLPSLPQPN